MANTKLISGLILGLIIVTVLFNVYASLMPEAQTAGDALTDNQTCVDAGGYWNETDSSCDTAVDNATAVTFTSIPLGGLFAGTGVIFLIIMAALLVVVVRNYLAKK